MKYAPSTGCFYPDDIAYPEGSIPNDAIETAREVFAAWCAATPGSSIAIVNGGIEINPPRAPTLDQIKAVKIGRLNAEYQVSAAAPIQIKTSAGATALFSRDAAHKAMVDFAISQGVAAWNANVWIDAENAPVMPFSFADLETLQAALIAPTKPGLMDLMAKVGAVNSATSAEAVNSVSF